MLTRISRNVFLMAFLFTAFFNLVTTNVSDAAINHVAAVDLTGTYKSNYGKVTMVQDKNSVYGKLVYPNGVTGTFKGIVRSSTLVMVWENPKDYGVAKLKIYEMGTSLSGTFTDQNGKTGNWKLKKVN